MNQKLRRSHIGACTLVWFVVAGRAVASPEPTIRVIGEAADVSRLQGMAPYVLNVDAVQTHLESGDLLASRFEWDFGEGAGVEYNQLAGWGGAHVYDRPGTYRLSLTVTDIDGRQGRREIEVAVLPDTRARIYVSAAGSDQNDGSSPTTPVRSIQRVQRLLTDDRAVLFRRGETFDFARDQLVLEDLSNVVLGAYGEGPRPILMGRAYDPNGQDTLITLNCHSQGPAVERITIQDLEFRTPSAASAHQEFNHIAIQVHGRDINNVVVRRCYFDDVGSCFLTGSGDWNTRVDSNVHPAGVLLMENELEESSRYFTFFTSNNTTLLGNRSTGGSHTSFIFRFYADRVFIHHNDWQQPVSTFEEYAIAGGQHCNREEGNLLADCEPEHENHFWGQHCYVANNHFDGTLRLGYENTDTIYSYYRWIVLENNLFTRSAPNQSPTPTFRHWKFTDRLAVRNNIFAGPVGILSLTGQGVTDIRFQHNTGVDPLNGNSFVNMFGPDPSVPGAIQIENNLWISPNYRPSVGGGWPYVINVPSGNLRGYVFRNNRWPQKLEDAPGEEIFSGGDVFREDWNRERQVSGDRFHRLTLADINSETFSPLPGNESLLQVSAIDGVMHDYHGRARPEEGSWTVGAVDLNAVARSLEPEPAIGNLELRIVVGSESLELHIRGEGTVAIELSSDLEEWLPAWEITSFSGQAVVPIAPEPGATFYRVGEIR